MFMEASIREVSGPPVSINQSYHFLKESAHLGGGFEYCLFSPYLGKISNLTNIFQMG